MGIKRIGDDEGLAALAGRQEQMPMAVRYLLQRIKEEFPGNSVELRIPPFGAVQCVAGLNHRRGTPPNVIELSPEDFLDLCLGELGWDAAVVSGKLIASGTLTDELSQIFPLEL